MKSCSKGHCSEGVSSLFAAAYFILVCFSVDKLLVSLCLFLVIIVLFQFPVSSTSEVVRCAKSSERQRSQWLTESENHCKLPWFCAAGLGWSNCPAEGKETAIFPDPLAPLLTTALRRNGCSSDIPSLLGFYLGFRYAPKQMDQHTLHTPSSKGQVLPTSNSFWFRLHADFWVKQCHETFWYLYFVRLLSSLFRQQIKIGFLQRAVQNKE